MVSSSLPKIFLLIDNSCYSNNLLYAACDFAALAGHAGYANVKIIMPPSILFEATNREAISAADLPDLKVKKLADKMLGAIASGHLIIPPETEKEAGFFDLLREKVKGAFPDPTQFTNKPHLKTQIGKYQPFVWQIGKKPTRDLGDHAFDEWHKSHVNTLGEALLVLATHDKALRSAIEHREWQERSHCAHSKFCSNVGTLPWFQQARHDLVAHMESSGAASTPEITYMLASLDQHLAQVKTKRERTKRSGSYTHDLPLDENAGPPQWKGRITKQGDDSGLDTPPRP